MLCGQKKVLQKVLCYSTLYQDIRILLEVRKVYERFKMVELSVNKFRSNLKAFVDRAIDEHMPLKITRRAGRDFVVVSAEDWEREQETLYVLQNASLMKQIFDSTITYQEKTGYHPTKEELDEINSI
jgi:antitoxin YefM